MDWSTFLAGRQVSDQAEGVITLCLGLGATFIGWLTAIEGTGFAEATVEWRHQSRRDISDPFRKHEPTADEIASLRLDWVVTRFVGWVFAVLGPIGVVVGTVWIVQN